MYYRHLSLLALCSLLLVGDAYSQFAVTPPRMTCSINVTVTDPSGAVIQDAFVALRADRRSASNEWFELETQTDASGKVETVLPCGFIDVFATQDGFFPFAQKLRVYDKNQTVSVPLAVYPTENIHEVPIVPLVPTQPHS